MLNWCSLALLHEASILPMGWPVSPSAHSPRFPRYPIWTWTRRVYFGRFSQSKLRWSRARINPSSKVTIRSTPLFCGYATNLVFDRVGGSNELEWCFRWRFHSRSSDDPPEPDPDGKRHVKQGIDGDDIANSHHRPAKPSAVARKTVNPGQCLENCSLHLFRRCVRIRGRLVRQAD